MTRRETLTLLAAGLFGALGVGVEAQTRSRRSVSPSRRRGSAQQVPAPAEAQRSGDRLADLATEVVGIYYGDVISDARGSSREGVTITVTRVASNVVEVTSDYARIPRVRIRIQRALNAIVQADGDYVFLIQLDADPRQLSLTIDDASLSVRRR